MSIFFTVCCPWIAAQQAHPARPSLGIRALFFPLKSISPAFPPLALDQTLGLHMITFNTPCEFQLFSANNSNQAAAGVLDRGSPVFLASFHRLWCLSSFKPCQEAPRLSPFYWSDHCYSERLSGLFQVTHLESGRFVNSVMSPDPV